MFRLINWAMIASLSLTVHPLDYPQFDWWTILYLDVVSVLVLLLVCYSWDMISEVEFSQQDYDIFTKFKEVEVIAHKKGINAIEWNTLGSKLITASDNLIKIWNYDDITGIVKASEPKTGHDTVIDSAKWADSNTLLTVSKEAFKIWDIREAKPVRSDRNEKKGKPDFTKGDWNPEGNSFAIGTKENVINIFDKRSQGVVESLKFASEIDQFGWDKSSSIFVVGIWE